jgi:hypothetical protein
MHPSLEKLIKAHRVLKKLDQKVTYVGGAVIPLYMEDTAAEKPRPTLDVDTVVKITTYGEYVRTEQKLRLIGLKPSPDPEAPVCRWKYEDLEIDVMPARGDFFGFSNQWYEEGIAHAVKKDLAEKLTIQVFSPVYLFADKINTFLDRGSGDYYASYDFEDIIRLVDGYPNLIPEIKSALPDVKKYIQNWVKNLLNQPRVRDYLAAHVIQQGRAEVLQNRLKKIFD